MSNISSLLMNLQLTMSGSERAQAPDLLQQGVLGLGRPLVELVDELQVLVAQQARGHVPAKDMRAHVRAPVYERMLGMAACHENLADTIVDIVNQFEISDECVSTYVDHGISLRSTACVLGTGALMAVSPLGVRCCRASWSVTLRSVSDVGSAAARCRQQRVVSLPRCPARGITNSGDCRAQTPTCTS